MPVSLSVSLGLKPSWAQSLAWKRTVCLEIAPRLELNVAAICFSAQLVGLIAKPGRSTSTLTDRSRTGTPLTTTGSGSDTTVRCASTGST